MRILITFLLLSSICLAGIDDVRRAALMLPPGSPIELKLKSKEKLIARLESIQAEHITITVLDPNAASPREIPFKEIKSLKEHDRCESSRGWAATGQVLLGLWIILTLLSVAFGG
jgi:hypothetical protein